MAQSSDAGDAAFVITRRFDAPRERVFEAWTETDRLTQWFGPKGMTMPVCATDLRPGGVFHYCLLSPGGREMWGRLPRASLSAPGAARSLR